MPLLPLQIAMGLNTKSDPKLLPPGAATKIENLEQTRSGELSKRSGVTARSKASSNIDNPLGFFTGPRSIVSAHQLATHGAAVGLIGFLQQDSGEQSPGMGWRGCVYVNGPASWYNTRPFVPARISLGPAIPARGDLERITGGGDSALQFFGGKESVNQSLMSRVDPSSGFASEDIDYSLLSSNEPFVGWLKTAQGTNVLLWPGSTNRIFLMYINGPTDAEATFGFLRSTGTTSLTDFNASELFDSFHNDFWGGVVAYETTSNEIAVRRVTFNEATGEHETLSSLTIAEDPQGAIGICEQIQKDGTRRLVILYQLTSNGRVRAEFIDETFTATGAPVDVSNDFTATTVTHLTGAPQEDSADSDSPDLGAWLFVGSDDTDKTVLDLRAWDGGIVTAATDFELENTRPVSKGFSHKGRAFVWLASSSVESQAAYRLAYCPGYSGLPGGWASHCARAGLGRAKFQADGLGLPTVSDLGDGVFGCPVILTVRTKNDGQTTDRGAMLSVDLEPPPSKGVRIYDQTFYGGALPWTFNGSEFVDVNFSYRPENLQAVSGGAGAMTGTFSFVIVYEWIDAAGLVYKSGPSAVAVYSASAEAIDLTWDDAGYLLDPKRTGSNPGLIGAAAAGDRFIAKSIYMTLDSDTVFYKLAEVTTNATSYTVDTSLASLTDNELLYTTGAVLDNAAPPAGHVVAADSERAYIASAEDPGLIYYAKLGELGDALAFNLSSYIRLNVGGEVTAMDVIDDTKIVFGENAIVGFSGPGPSDTNQGGFSRQRRISSDAGAIKDSPTLSTDAGIWFVSKSGIQLLTRSFTREYVGAAVSEITRDLNILSIDIVEPKQQIRFAASNGTVLVFDYFHKFWSVFKNDVGGLVDAVSIDGVWHWLRADGTVFVENQEHDQDVSTVWESGWIALGTLAGKQSTTWAIVTGEKHSGGKMLLEMLVDFDENQVVKSKIVDTAELDGEGFQYRWKLGARVNSALKIRITQYDTEGSHKGCSIAQVGLEVVAKTGTARLSADRSG